MGIVEHLLLPPSAQHFGLLPLLIFFLLMLHLPYVGLLMVSSALSVAHRIPRPGLARQFIDLVAANRAGWLIFGIIPLVCLLLLLSQYLYGAEIPIDLYLERFTVIALSSMFLLFVYQRTLNPVVGVLGHLGLVGSYFFFVSIMDLVAHPGRWMFEYAPLPHVFSIQVIVHFGIFSLLGILLTGAAILFFNFRWEERRLPDDAPARNQMLYWGLGLLAGASVLIPVHIVWDLATAPSQALSYAAFGLAIAVVALLCLTCLAAVAMLLGKHTKLATPALVLAIVVFGLVQFKGLNLQATANQEFLRLLAQQAETTRDAAAAAQAGLYKPSEPDPELGRQIFDDRCSACHKWDEMVVGPAYLDVVP